MKHHPSSENADAEGLAGPTAQHSLDFPLLEQRCQLVVEAGPLAGKTVVLSTESETRLGRAANNELVVPDAAVSQHHCTISWEGHGWLLRDLRSSNGTYIDNTRVKEAFLRTGAVIRLGECRLKMTSGLGPVLLTPSAKDSFSVVMGRSAAMREIFTLLERLAKRDATVLLVGETGTGKGAVARAIHEESGRSGKPWVTVDCGAVAASLIESELFGHEKGAFTGASQRRIGALEYAAGGTLFLDELDDLRLDLQPKLLRALEERTFMRVGGAQRIPFKGRVIAATKQDLSTMVAAGQFREDLYFRLAVFQIRLPPLRERIEDLPLLVDRFASAYDRPSAWIELSEEVRVRLNSHRWPGNVRELRNAVERAFTLVEGIPGPAAWELGQPPAQSTGGLPADYHLPFKAAKEKLVDTFEKQYLTQLLRRVGGNIARAAREADMDRKHLYTLLHKHALLSRDDGQSDA